MARRAAICAAEQQYRQLVQTSRQAVWHKQAPKNNEPLRPAQQLSRAEEVVLHRLRLGYNGSDSASARKSAAASYGSFKKNLHLLLEVARAAPPPMNTKEAGVTHAPPTCDLTVAAATAAGYALIYYWVYVSEGKAWRQGPTTKGGVVVKSYEEAIKSPPITLMLHHHYLPSHSSAPPFTLTRPGETTFTIPQQNYHTIAPQSPQPPQQTPGSDRSKSRRPHRVRPG
ncbi:hypothetical protein GWK47_000810 [Chionoecetes opilio]|uniref:Uncharacterized protein n=1 Tax=Chionoecetes opilio TaxID=41210 RepID=A0A8J5CSC0_CHIOP|nr:hypothetical protein GWK47_000810 [Chionoecetes opilio]